MSDVKVKIDGVEVVRGDVLKALFAAQQSGETMATVAEKFGIRPERLSSWLSNLRSKVEKAGGDADKLPKLEGAGRGRAELSFDEFMDSEVAIGKGVKIQRSDLAEKVKDAAERAITSADLAVELGGEPNRVSAAISAINSRMKEENMGQRLPKLVRKPRSGADISDVLAFLGQ